MNIKFAFFGSSKLSTIVLDELYKQNIVPSIVITTIDKPVGRKQILTPNIVKTWALDHKIPVLDPIKLNEEFITKFEEICKKEQVEIYLVASYSKIIPKKLVDLPQKGIVNIHPSLLPKYRGPSPLGSAILNDDKHTGVCLMKMDEEMDHGPIIACKEVEIDEWPVYEIYEENMAKIGAQLFIENLEKYFNGEIKTQNQDHTKATFTKKFEKSDGQIDLNDKPRNNWLKYCAFHEWPKTFFIHKHNNSEIRIKITDASFENGNFVIKKVIPEGSKEMTFDEFKRGY